MFVNATGAQGGNNVNGPPGGLGGWVQASLSVTAGQILYIYVGGDGITAGSFNGGGGARGGGATDVRTISGNLTSRLIVVGGGGGTVYFNQPPAGDGGTKISLRFCLILFLPS